MNAETRIPRYEFRACATKVLFIACKPKWANTDAGSGDIWKFPLMRGKPLPASCSQAQHCEFCSTMAHEWYYSQGAECVGPISQDDLVAILSKVSRANEVLVWRDGFSAWKPAGLVSELASHILNSPPRAPPPCRRHHLYQTRPYQSLM